MIQNNSRSGKRSAFTMIELMVVILIMAILTSLISSVVVKAMGKMTGTQTRQEITDMEVALKAFMLDYGLTEPPPSYLVLNEANPLAITTDPLDQGQSAAFLEKMFGKDLGKQGGVDWNGDGQINGPWPPLQGERCLVFYLGGIPNSAAVVGGAPPSPLGFSTNNMKPSYGSMLGETLGKRKGPYFNFKTTRLWPQPQQVPLGWPGFFYYLDPWMTKSGPLYLTLGGSPYVFFSSAGINNQYAITTDFGAYPYMTATGQYTNPNTYQIISAGKDGTFGGPWPNLWDPSSGATGYGADDQANFSATLLGAGQN